MQNEGRPLRGFLGGSHYFASRGAREAGNRRLSPRLHGGVACYTGLSRGTRQVARFGRPQSRSSVSAAVGRGATYVSASSHLAINVSSLHVKGGEMRFRFAGHHRSRRMPPAWLCPSIAGRRTRRCLLELGRMTRSWGLAIADNATVHPGKLGGVVSRFDIFFFGLMIASPVRSGWVRSEEGTCQFPSRIPTSVSYSVSPSHINSIIPPRAEPRQTAFSTNVMLAAVSLRGPRIVIRINGNKAPRSSPRRVKIPAHPLVSPRPGHSRGRATASRKLAATDLEKERAASPQATSTTPRSTWLCHHGCRVLCFRLPHVALMRMSCVRGACQTRRCGTGPVELGS